MVKGKPIHPSQQSGGDYAPPAYGSPADSYTAPASGGFAEIEEDGELPF